MEVVAELIFGVIAGIFYRANPGPLRRALLWCLRGATALAVAWWAGWLLHLAPPAPDAAKVALALPSLIFLLGEWDGGIAWLGCAG